MSETMILALTDEPEAAWVLGRVVESAWGGREWEALDTADAALTAAEAAAELRVAIGRELGGPTIVAEQWVEAYEVAVDDVERLARIAAAAVEERDEAIRSAVASGRSLRDVAQGAGISHEQVRRIASR